MVNDHSFANPFVRAAVRTVLAGSAMAAVFGVAHAANAQKSQEANDPPAPAAASAAVPQLQEVVVTGTLIATAPGQVQMSAISNISPLEVQQSGAVRIEDLLDTLPQVTASQNSTVSNGATGTATVDLRDLGDNRTLVLVDGHRLNPGDPRTGGPADLNMIPTALISNIQVLTGGASTIYGADAAAGVVNFQLNQHFQGLKVVLDGGIYNNSGGGAAVNQAITDFQNTYHPLLAFKQGANNFWGGAQKQITVIGGLNTPDGNGNAVVYFSYRNVNAILQKSYPYSGCSLGSGYVAGSSNTGGKFTCLGSSSGYPGRFFDFQTGAPFGGDMTINPTGGVVGPYSPAGDYNFGPANFFQRPDERYLAGALMHYTFNPHATFYSDTMFMDDQSLAQIAPSATFFNAFKVNCNNPFLSPSEVTSWCTDEGLGPNGFASMYIGRRNIEGGARVDNLEHVEFLENLGLKGQINSAWTYDAHFQYGFTDLLENYENDLSVTKLNDAFDVVNVGGTPECAVTAAGVQNGLGVGCVPYNIFGNGGSLYMPPSAAVGYIQTPGVSRGKVDQWITGATLDGDLGKYGIRLPSASSGVKVAVGVDYRDIKDFTLPDVEFQTNDLAGQGSATLPIHGDSIVHEGYGEVRVPLVDNKPFIRHLDVDGSYRYSGYSKFNGASRAVTTNTYAFSADWEPAHDYAFHANFARAVRAPNISELYTADTVALDGTADYCAGPSPTYSLAQCERTGVTPAFYGSVAPNPAAQYNGLLGGNFNLNPETVLTKTFGFTWTPSYVHSLRATLNYYDIKVENVIESVGANTILKLCLTSDTFCSQIHRGPGETLWLPGGYVADTKLNAGTIEVKGADLSLLYSLGLHAMGRLTVNYSGSYMASYDIVPYPGAAQFNCAGYMGSGCQGTGEGGEPLPKYKHTLRVTWFMPWGGMDASAQWRYIGPVTLYQLSPNPNLGCLPGCTIANGGVSSTDARFPSFSYLDLTVSGQLPPSLENVAWRVGMNNVLDKAPPLQGLTNLSGFGNGNTYPGIYDANGRYLFAELSVQF
ncbi:MAG TPA: TonB-dependent receptor [Steroidobacteraceae bacterium]|nr:TonB-dependent receptor [Steroidobacteraceae bacterium]